MKNKSEFEYAPLRSLDDFLLGSARFQLPNFSDWERWGNRIVSNLLYYQSNYMLMAIIIFIICGLIHPIQIITGFFTIIVITGVFLYLSNDSGSLGEFKRRHPIISAGTMFVVSYYVLATLLGSLLVFLFAVLLPFCATFIHASLRLRNLKNKLVNTFEPIGFSLTPMAYFLEEMGIQLQKSAVKLTNFFKSPSTGKDLKSFKTGFHND